MNGSIDQDPLDDLLANSALIADRGFSERLRYNLSKATSLRFKIFASMGGIWLVLAVFLVSPRTLYERLSSITENFNFIELGSMLSIELNYTGLSSMQLPMLYIVILLLSIPAIFSFMLSD